LDAYIKTTADQLTAMAAAASTAAVAAEATAP